MDTIDAGKKQSILNYFKRKEYTSSRQNSQFGKTNKVLVTSCPVTNNENLDEKSKDCDIETNCTINSNIVLLPLINDIALFINRSLNDEEKLLVLKNSTVELMLWKVKLSRLNFVPKTSLEAFLLCDSKIFPNINKLLKIVCTFRQRPLRELFQHSNENRLNGLCMLSVHKNITATPDEVLNVLSLFSRKLDVVL